MPKCNPASRARHGKDGECICNAPYTGDECYQCIQGYTAKTIRSTSHEKNVVLCQAKPDNDVSDCNGNGHYQPSSRKCACDKGFTGDFCEKCEDSKFEYPDCSESTPVDLSSSASLKGIFKRRKQNVYHSNYLQEDRGGVFQQQCQNNDYPTFLNQIGLHKEFKSGNFHIANTYVANHDADNVIEFTPRTRGLIKIMVKQPEMEMIADSEETMAIELGVVK